MRRARLAPDQCGKRCHWACSQPQQDIGITLTGNHIVPALVDSCRAKLATSKALLLRWKDDVTERGAALKSRS